MSSASYPSAVVDLADSWHRLAGAQVTLSQSESAARNAVTIESLRHETSDAFDIQVQLEADALAVRVTPTNGRADRLHVWATAELVVVRSEGDQSLEHLVRLPAPVDPDDVEVKIEENALLARFARRSEMPVVVWPR
jgi:hypothetical protein